MYGRVLVRGILQVGVLETGWVYLPAPGTPHTRKQGQTNLGAYLSAS